MLEKSEYEEKAERRHPSTLHMIRMLKPNPNLQGLPGAIAHSIYNQADMLVDELPDDPELTAGLRKLLEAKDCFVRAAVFADPSNWGPENPTQT